ncbi:MAG TPA: hypothetical protein PKI34_06880 [Bacteroidales bacterium]|nr:hypothetical protein [Bacteroidales bacterium]
MPEISITGIKRSIFLIFLTAFIIEIPAKGQQLKLKVTGDEQNGFHVELFDLNRLLVTNPGEFTMQLHNTDMSATAEIRDWKGTQWSGNDEEVILMGDTYLQELDAKLSVTVRYEVINTNVVKKTIRLFQPSMTDMYYILKETARPAQKPLKYTTFECDSFPGGLVHEMYPAAGWVTPDHQVVGLLTDAGYLNQFTRTTRRRFSGRGGGFVGMRKLPDPELYAVSTQEEQEEQNEYVRLTFGEMYNLDAGSTRIIPAVTISRKVGKVEVEQNDSLITLICHPCDRAGIEYIAPFEDQKVYTISFDCRGNTPVALKLFRIRNGMKTIELEEGVKYIDQFPAGEQDWTFFKGSILVPYTGHDSVSLFIGTQSGMESRLQIKNLQFTEHQPQREPYNLLPLGQSAEKVTYIFAEHYTNHKEFMIASQTRLAEGKGFKGSQIEKMLYANLQMLTWITSVHDMTPFNVPNKNYSPDMYNRDSFFSAVATYQKELNLALWEQWGKTQTPEGGIGTIITPYMGSVEVKDNEATIEWLIWAMLNKRRFGISLPQDKIKKAVDYVLNEFDPDRNAICKSRFSLSQVDIVDFDPKTDRLAVNQGMLAVALRTIKELGFELSEAYLEKAEQAYRNFYDPQRRHLLFDRNYPDIISLTDLEPEFFSLWLFGRPLLTDEIVINHLDQMPVLNRVPDAPHPEYGTTAPICVRLINDGKSFAYLSGDYQPFAEFGEANYSDGRNDGYYYNGGSWLRAEYSAYAAGMKHGWEKAGKLMENRIWAEINLHPDWPFSKEFIPTKWTSTDSWWVSTKGLCWNVFILMANELVGLRTPDMDPDYPKR